VLPPYWEGNVVVAGRKTNFFFFFSTTVSMLSLDDGLIGIDDDAGTRPCSFSYVFHDGRLGEILDWID